MDRITDAAEVLAEQIIQFSTDDPTRVRLASMCQAELGRRLNHSTRSRGAFTWPYELAEVVGDVHSTSTRLGQLLDQLAVHADRFMEHPDLVTDAPGREAGEQAGMAAIQLRSAKAMLAGVTERLGKAQGVMETLAIAVPDEVS